MTHSRQEILSLNEVFSEHLISLQKAKYSPSNEWKAGQSAYLDDPDTLVILTQKQAEALNTKDHNYYEENRDAYQAKSSNTWEGGATLISTQKTPHTYLNDLGQSLALLSDKLGKLIVLGDWNIPWLSQKNDYPPATEAIAFLEEKMDAQFSGGLVLNNSEILAFIPHLFWLIRCNASLPEFMMCFEKSKTIIGICKYGALHLEFYDAKEKADVLTYFDGKGFEKIDRCYDPVEFDHFDGRKIETKE